jgi:hypothetical protein
MYTADDEKAPPPTDEMKLVILYVPLTSLIY